MKELVVIDIKTGERFEVKRTKVSPCCRILLEQIRSFAIAASPREVKMVCLNCGAEWTATFIKKHYRITRQNPRHQK